MKKVYAEIIAGLIPHKMTRNRWRGALRYGVRKGLKLRRELHNAKNNSNPDIYLAVCAISKDEGPYLREWVEWHISKGVDRIYFYDNGSTDDSAEILRPYIESGVVEYNYFPGHRMQLAAYDHCIKRHRYDTRWLAFIDIDEFIVPVRDNTIPEFLKNLEDTPAVEINWLIYGSNGHEKKSIAPVMKRFTRHSLPEHPLNRHVKSIVNPRRVYGMTGCHEAARINGKAVDSHGRIIKKNFRDRVPQHDIIRINHYAVKSREEFLDKQKRGRASGRHRNVPDEYFELYNLNDLDD